MKQTSNVKPILMPLLAAALLASFIGCSKPVAESTKQEITKSDSSTNAELFSVPQEQMQHVQIVTVQASSMPRVMRLTGTVAFNGFETTPVITQVGGPVSRILVSPGQLVHKQQPLLYVSSPDYSQLRAAYLKARDTHSLAHKNYVRAKDLYEHHAIAERDLQSAESAEVQAQADLQASEQSLKVLGVPRPDTLIENPTSPEVPVIAPITGGVVERLCAPGQVIAPGQTQCFTISNMSTVWVLANLYQNQLAFVHVGDPVIITTDAYKQEFHGRISFLGAALDPTSRTLQARIDTQNVKELLKKDMYVTATVSAGKIENALLLPDSAILRDTENVPYVYIESGTNQFARRTVQIGDSANGKTQVTSGLQAGDKVAGDGSLFLQFANSQQQ
jgi:cobalt-zinc-cadmium efflux system membrane fusion protein